MKYITYAENIIKMINSTKVHTERFWPQNILYTLLEFRYDAHTLLAILSINIL